MSDDGGNTGSRRFVDDSGSSSGASVSTSRCRTRRVVSDNSDSDSGSEIETQSRKRRVPRVKSDNDSDSSGSIITKRLRGPLRLASESESASGSSSSAWETEHSDTETAKVVVKPKTQDVDIESDSSDGQSEKCPICLLSFTTQEIGTPESCDHVFCADCIQEWSKNMNTCPVDRQEFRLILVRKRIDGKITRQISVTPPQPHSDVEIVEDPTFCEICGSSDREDRMLLCDGCDLGFHMHCLTPPLQTVPIGAWFCGDCSPDDLVDPEVEIYELQLLLDDAQRPVRRIPRQRRLAPRTGDTERLRRRIANNRTRQTTDASAAVSSTSTRTRRPKKKRKPRRNYRIVYTIDEATGETVAVKVPVKKRRKKRKNRIAKLPKTVKKRLALQLGMCARGSVPQNLPDVKVINPGNSGNIQRQRYNAGIPTLHLFGPQNDILLDDFSDIDDDNNGGVLSRRAPNRHDIAALRRARVKNSVSLPNNPVSSSSDLLGDILDCQAKFHSKNSKLSLGKDGRITVESKPVDLNNHQQSVRQRPLNYSNDSVPSSSGTSTYTPSNQQQENNSVPTSTVTSINPSNITTSQYGSQQQESEDFPSSQRNLSSSIYDPDDNPNKDKDNKKQDSRSNTPGSESEIDIYSDIETVSTSKNDETEYKPSPQQTNSNTPLTEEDDNDSEPDMVIDTEKPEPESDNVKDETVSSTVNSNLDSNSNNPQAVTSTSDLVESSTSHQLFNDGPVHEEEEDSEDGCPNFSIYSKESHTLAKNTDVTLDAGEDTNQVEEITSSPALVSADEIAHADREVGEIFDEPEQTEDEAVDKIKKKSSTSGLYSDSEDESVVKKGVTSSFGISDIANMTEDISEEERSYTPCLDERVPVTQGLDGLDTEMISDEERNDFDESHDLKTASDGGEALEINAKESELDFTRPEDYEEGEIVDKLKNVVIKPEEEVVVDSEAIKQDGEDKKNATNKKSKEGEHNNSKSSELSVTKIEKENEKSSANNKRQSTEKESAFKKLSRSNKERNYRDKDRDHKSRSRSRDKKDKEGSNKKSDRKRERRKEIERYDVRAIIADKPRRLKDKFGRDVRRTASRTRSRTRTPTSPVVVNRRSRSKRRRSLSRADRKTRRTAARRSSVSRSRTRSRDRRRNRSKEKKKTARRRTRSRSPSPPPKRQKEFGRRRSREWSASLSRSRSRSQQQQDVRHFTPSWTPPRVMESAVKQHNLTVILTNDNKKKKDKKKKEKRAKENEKVKKKKQSREVLRTPPPSKEVFASGDNILVSVSFNKENETSSRDISTKRKRDSMTTEESGVVKKRNKEKRVKSRLSKKPNKDLSGVKPVAIIDLERSPFKELTPSPKDVIVLSDSDNEDKGGDKNIICDSSSAQVASPERCITSYSSGPKTPPEPQVKFTLTSKTPQMRAISNPLHEPEEDVEQQTTCDGDVDDLHKGPNTPPDPPNSPPSSPDAYDPFEPTKSRSPTPDNKSTAGNQSSSQLNTDDNHPLLDQVGEIQPETSEKSLTQTPDALKSHTPPPLVDVQQPDSQSSIQATPESLIGGKSPADSGGSQTVSVKPVAQTVPLSSSSAAAAAAAAAATSLITSTPVSSNSRINVLNSMPVPRIVLPSPVKISPTKSTSAVKATPIKPMVSSKSGSTNRGNKNQNGGSGLEVTGESLSLDSPYSPGSSDYEDLFEPPSENVAGAKQAAATPAVKTAKTTKSPAKIQTAFDALFGSPFNKKGKGDNSKGGNKFVTKKAALASGKTKQVGVKVDEDSLKILDELPNSAVEMQVKDKFLKKLNRQERVVEEVKLVLKPHYNKKHINKEEYKDILRRAVPKICHNKSGEINPTKIKHLIEAYVKKVRHSKKVTSSSSVNPQKA